MSAPFIEPEMPQKAAPDRIADYLRDAILNGEFQPGDFIRQEDIARRLGASRLPVREALRILEVEGLTTHQANRGAQVPKLTLHEMDVIYQLRERMEPLILQESIPHLTTADIVEAHALLEKMEAGVSVSEFIPLDRAFHFLTYRGCRIQTLTTMAFRLWNSTQHYRRLFVQHTDPGRHWVVDTEHRLLLDAIERRDSVAAQHVLAGHISRTRIELAANAEAARLIESPDNPPGPNRPVGNGEV